MRLNSVLFLACTVCIASATGCGAGNPQNPGSSAVSTLRSAILDYNHSTDTGSLASTRAGCVRATQTLSAKEREVSRLTATGARLQALRDIQNAYATALRGFKACASASSSLSYPQMIAAIEEFASANHWVALARKADSA